MLIFAHASRLGVQALVERVDSVWMRAICCRLLPVHNARAAPGATGAAVTGGSAGTGTGAAAGFVAAQAPSKSAKGEIAERAFTGNQRKGPEDCSPGRSD
jgi:hypothetical protein